MLYRVNKYLFNIYHWYSTKYELKLNPTNGSAWYSIDAMLEYYNGYGTESRIHHSVLSGSYAVALASILLIPSKPQTAMGMQTLSLACWIAKCNVFHFDNDGHIHVKYNLKSALLSSIADKCLVWLFIASLNTIWQTLPLILRYIYYAYWQQCLC